MRWVTVCGLLLGLVQPVLAASTHVSWVGRSDGLPSSQVHATVVGPGGAAWIAGPSGLARYDGARVGVWLMEEGLSTQGLRSLATDERGRLWIGTDINVDVMDGDRIHPLVAPEEWSYGFVENMVADGSGGMWLATARGLVHYQESSGFTVAADPRLQDRLVSDVAVDARGVTWVAVPTVGLLRRASDGWALVSPDGLESVETLAVSVDGGLIAGGLGGFVEFDADGNEQGVKLGEPALHVTAFLALDEHLWVGVGDELRRYSRRDEGWFLEEVVLDSQVINDLATDSLGSVWISTNGDGVGKISALRAAIRRASAPCSGGVFAIAPSSSGELLVGGESCSWRMDAKTLRVLGELEELRENRVWDLFEAKDGTVWAATEQGLYAGSLEEGLSRRSFESAALASPGRALIETSAGLFVGTVAGLSRLSGDVQAEILDPDGQALGYVYTLVDDGRGRLWIGTIGRGLWSMRLAPGDGPAGEVEQTLATGLTGWGNTYAIAVSESGRMAVVQDDRIVVLAEESETRVLRPASGEAVAGWSARFEGEERLWVGTNSGLSGYDLDKTSATVILTESAGLSGTEFTTSRSLWRALDGTLYCGLSNGLTAVSPSLVSSLVEVPQARLGRVVWPEGVAHDARTAVSRIPHGNWTLSFEPASPWFLDERSLSIRHRLKGFDDAWSEPRELAGDIIRYTGLPNGRYELLAQVHSPLVGWGAESVLAGFQVAPPWWASRAAQLVWVALATLLAIGVWRWRNRRFRWRAEQLEIEIRQRTAELELAKQEFEALAHRDILTGLGNQRAFWEHAKRLEADGTRYGVQFAIIVGDLDGFKRINDEFGHKMGDEVLRGVAQELRSVVREEDLLVRYGGDEFVTLVTHGTDEAAMLTGKRMRSALADFEVDLEGRVAKISASFGIALWEGPGDSIDGLFHRADLAMYEAKQQGLGVMLWRR